LFEFQSQANSEKALLVLGLPLNMNSCTYFFIHLF